MNRHFIKSILIRLLVALFCPAAQAGQIIDTVTQGDKKELRIARRIITKPKARDLRKKTEEREIAKREEQIGSSAWTAKQRRLLLEKLSSSDRERAKVAKEFWKFWSWRPYAYKRGFDPDPTQTQRGLVEFAGQGVGAAHLALAEGYKKDRFISIAYAFGNRRQVDILAFHHTKRALELLGPAGKKLLALLKGLIDAGTRERMRECIIALAVAAAYGKDEIPTGCDPLQQDKKAKEARKRLKETQGNVLSAMSTTENWNCLFFGLQEKDICNYPYPKQFNIRPEIHQVPKWVSDCISRPEKPCVPK